MHAAAALSALGPSLFVQRHHLGNGRLQRRDTATGRRVRAHELGWRTTAGSRHLLPQADSGIRVIARTRSQLQPDQVGLVLVAPTVGQGEAVLHHRIGHRQATFPQPQQSAGALLGQFDTVGLGHGFAAVFAQRVRHLVTHDRGDLVVAQLELLDDAAVEDDLAARPAVGVDIILMSATLIAIFSIIELVILNLWKKLFVIFCISMIQKCCFLN